MNKRWPYGGKNRKLKTRKRLKPFTFYREENITEEEVKSTMDKFWELLAKSTIFQGLITLLLLSTMCYLWATSQEVPDSLVQSSTLVLGFFFGAKAQTSLQAKVK